MNRPHANNRRWQHGLRSILLLHDAPWRWKVGLEAALAMGIPLGLFTLAGHQSEGLVASLGAFTALYFAGLHPLDRLRLLPLIAFSFSIGSLLGVLTASNMILTMLLLIGVASTASILSLGVGIGPPGPMMFVLVAGVSNHIAGSGAYNDAFWGKWSISALVATGAVAAYLIVVAQLILPAMRRRSAPAPDLRAGLRFVHWDLTSRIIAYRVILAVTIATVIAVPLEFDHPYWPVMVAGVVLQVSHSLRRTVIRVVHRLSGTLLGLVGFSVLVRLEPDGMLLVLVLACLQGIVEVVVARHYGLALLFITPLALTIATSNQQTSTGDIANERILDTLLGAAIAMGVLLVSEWYLNTRRDPRGAL